MTTIFIRYDLTNTERLDINMLTERQAYFPKMLIKNTKTV